jgi:beta-lactamase class D
MANALGFLALLLAAVASSGNRPAPAPSPAPSSELPSVVVDFSMRSGSYRVTGDAALLSQRFTPGTTLDLMIAIAALEAGELTPGMEIPTRDGPMKLPQALKESNEEFFTQVLKRAGYEPVRKLLLRTRYTPGIPEAVASFAELARGEPLRVTVFEQNLFLQSFVKREIPIGVELCAALEKSLAVTASKPSWGQSGWGEISPEGPRYVSWFNGAANLKDGTHVITIAALTSKPAPLSLDRFRRYLDSKR